MSFIWGNFSISVFSPLRGTSANTLWVGVCHSVSADSYSSFAHVEVVYC